MIFLTELLLEVLIENLPPDILLHKIPNPRANETGRKEISIKYALSFPRNDVAYVQAKNYLSRFYTGAKQSQEPSARQKAAGSSSSNVPGRGYEMLQQMVNAGNQINLGTDPLSDNYARKEFEAKLPEVHPDLTSDGVYSALAQILEVFSGGDNIEMTVSTDNDYESDGQYISIGMNKPRSFDPIGAAGFVFPKHWDTYEEPYFYTDLLKLDAETGAGVKTSGMQRTSLKLISKMIDICDSMGISKIKFTAGLSTGGYLWALLGATPDKLKPSFLKETKRRATFLGELATKPVAHRVLSAIKKVPVGGDEINRVLDEQFEALKKSKEFTPDDILEAERSIYQLLSVGLTYNDDLDDKIRRKMLMDMIDMNNMGTMNMEIDALQTVIDNMEIDPSLITVLANSPFGRFMLQGQSWNGSFNIEKGSATREIIEAQIGKNK